MAEMTKRWSPVTPLRTVPVEGSQKTACDPDQPGKTTSRTGSVLGFTTWCVSASRTHPSVNQEGNRAASDKMRRCASVTGAVWPLTSPGLSGPLGSNKILALRIFPVASSGMTCSTSVHDTPTNCSAVRLAMSLTADPVH